MSLERRKCWPLIWLMALLGQVGIVVLVYCEWHGKTSPWLLITAESNTPLLIARVIVLTWPLWVTGLLYLLSLVSIPPRLRTIGNTIRWAARTVLWVLFLALEVCGGCFLIVTSLYYLLAKDNDVGGLGLVMGIFMLGVGFWLARDTYRDSKHKAGLLRQPRLIKLDLQDYTAGRGSDFRIVHLSDIHATCSATNEIHTGGRFYEYNLERLLKEVNRARPNVLILTGDLTDSGEDEEWQIIRQCLQCIRVPIAVVPGNHDLLLSTDLYQDRHGIETQYRIAMFLLNLLEFLPTQSFTIMPSGKLVTIRKIIKYHWQILGKYICDPPTLNGPRNIDYTLEYVGDWQEFIPKRQCGIPMRILKAIYST